MTELLTLPAALLLGLAASGHCIVMCGGSGGTSGSVFTSSTTGILLDNASSHAGPTCSGSSTKMPRIAS